MGERPDVAGLREAVVALPFVSGKPYAVYRNQVLAIIDRALAAADKPTPEPARDDGERDDAIHAAVVHAAGYSAYRSASAGAFLGALKERGFTVTALAAPGDEARVDELAGAVTTEIVEAYALNRDHRHSRWHEEQPSADHRESWACVPLSDAVYAVMAAAHRAALRSSAAATATEDETDG